MPSATCLTGIASSSDILAHFKDFKRSSRVNPFAAEDLYFLQNRLTVLNPTLKMSPRAVRSTKQSEIIHVLIDQTSLN
jgi:hypothetical protein